MGGSQDDRCDPLATAEIGPGETAVPGGRLDAADERYMIEPSPRQHRLEVAQIGNVGHVPGDLARHRFPCLCFSARRLRDDTPATYPMRRVR
jgi:hypothetical protein